MKELEEDESEEERIQTGDGDGGVVGAEDVELEAADGVPEPRLGAALDRHHRQRLRQPLRLRLRLRLRRHLRLVDSPAARLEVRPFFTFFFFFISWISLLIWTIALACV